MKAKLVFFFFIFCFYLQSQIKKSVLFIGNSYTSVNNLPQMIHDLAISKSDTLDFDQSVVGGYTFQDHCNNAATWTKIRSKKWDVVVVQGQSQEPSLSPSTVLAQSYPFAKQLTDSIHANNPCTDAMFYMTWGRKNGDATNCGAYPPVCTFVGMQARLRESYMMFKDSFSTSVAPVGIAWKTFINFYPTVDLYDVDQSHPNLWGSYLTACVFYSSIFQKTSVGSSYNPSLPTIDVGNMQTVGSKTVLDSISVWNLNSQKPVSDFSFALISPLTYQFSNLSKNAIAFQWSFGSSLKNPTYTFPIAGTYSVKLKALNSCTTDSIIKTISVAGIENFQNVNSVKVLISNNYINLSSSLPNQKVLLTVYSMEGKKMKEFTNTINNESFDISDLISGIYLLSISSDNARKSLKFSHTD